METRREESLGVKEKIKQKNQQVCWFKEAKSPRCAKSPDFELR